MIETLRYDLRYSLRALWARPVFTLVVIAQLALGIGANATIFNRDFRLMWMGACVSTIGTFAQQCAQSWLIYDLTKDPSYLGLDLFLGCRQSRSCRVPLLC